MRAETYVVVENEIYEECGLVCLRACIFFVGSNTRQG